MFTKDDPEHIMVERMTRMFSNFAQFGDPNIAFDPILKDIKWRPNGYKYKKTNYLDIDVNMTMQENLYSDRYKIWDNLFPLKQLTIQDFLVLNSPPVTPVQSLYLPVKRKHKGCRYLNKLEP